MVRAHAEDGVDFVTIHAGMNRRVIESFKETGRLTNIVSRGGSLIFAWMEATGQREPLLRVLRRGARHLARARCDASAIGRRHASRLAATMPRTPGQIAELIEIGKLTQPRLGRRTCR